MQKEKIYAFRGYGQYYFYNDHDFNCFWTDSLEWCGGKWVDHSLQYVVAAHIAHLNDEGMQALTETEYKDVLERMKTADSEFYDYLSSCELVNGQTPETVYNVTIEEITINTSSRISDYPKGVKVIDMAQGEPVDVYLSDIIDNEIYGKYLYIKEN